MYTYICVYMSEDIYIHIYICIRILLEQRREVQRDLVCFSHEFVPQQLVQYVFMCMSIDVFMYIHM